MGIENTIMDRMKSMIYLDNAATTKVHPAVIQAMEPYWSEYYGNPASIYQFARKNQIALSKSRELIANSIHAQNTNEIYFTGGGSEGNNWIIKGIACALRDKGNHIITSNIEHASVIRANQFLEKMGYEVTYLDVDENGLVSLDELSKAIRPTTILISVMAANNEVGTLRLTLSADNTKEEMDYVVDHLVAIVNHLRANQ